MSPRTRLIAAAAAVLLIYATGVLTGSLTQRASHPRTAATGRSVLDQAERTIERRAAKPVPVSVLQRAAVQGMLKALGDQWSSYYQPSDYAHFQQVLAGAYTGVGVWVRRTAAGTLKIQSVQPDSPASAAGLLQGDVLVDVGGAAVANRTVANVVSGLRGRPGSEVSLVVDRGAQVITTSLRRTTIKDDDVTSSMLSPVIEDLRVSAFTRGVGRWVRAKAAAAEQRHLQGIVLDLRDDPGGLLDEAVETASAFLSSGPVVSYVQRGHSPQVLNALGGGNTRTPLVVLVDGGTASAAEIVTGALQDRGRAVVVGSQTFGKGSVQAPSQLSDGSALELTVGHYFTPSGRSLDGVGITPDVLVPAGTPVSVVDQRAIEVLSGITADTGSAGRG
jgi:carboxyl-terminal processing protease